MLSDGELMRRVQQGETASFAVLVRRYQSVLLRVAEARLGRRDWAEDVVQETFLAAFKSCRSFDLRASFRTWVWTILVNQCRRHFRSRQTSVPELQSGPGEVALVEVIACGQPTPYLQLVARERRELLERLLDELSAVQADALRLRFFGGLKFREIAEAMDCSLLTAKNRVRAGLLRMSHLLQDCRIDGAMFDSGDEP